ncbi:hypothetical protein FBY06_14016 [Pseudomonas sp. SJZ085]|uniref:hypothetical protein n=1 Tax=unclassified Pseudomonas TaxID=196821 RepID=UPI00119C0B4A|nr:MULTISPECIES: hypothetical protein [unclassified Pseudomonas]TWC12012.1 hypothetical protein FBX99_13916 [Pseudomonas sp. SJZ074]TWC30593.1 hypothetical protein FBY06_14016 [Pseudomonas sp. SJZ085]
MISQTQSVTLVRPVLQVSRLTQGERLAAVAIQPEPHFYVVAVGFQGPVGAVAEDVLARAAAAEQAANYAAAQATESAQVLDRLMQQLKGAFDYHAGAISAQGGK